MKTNAAPKEGLWIMIEEPIDAPTESTRPTEDAQSANQSFKDSYDYFPDFGI